MFVKIIRVAVYVKELYCVSFKFIRLIKRVTDLDVINLKNYKLLILSITLLFTTIPITLALGYIHNNFIQINFQDIPKNDLVSAVNFIFANTTFSFNDTVYQQVYDCPMESPISLIIAILAMLVLEN